ncbi:MAG: hypothetical protein COB36_05120 [Alphaproteobacteria bacterium]|nr:MAG: hypothetical protein COB36_05120 [Alphaproteobacteria bacterium]
MRDQANTHDDIQNPLDSVEDVLCDNNWVYNRMNNQELVVEIAGTSCNYRLLFVWQEHLNALQLCCQYNIKIKPENMSIAAMALMDMNAELWMGHFEITKSNLSPSFRQTCLIHGHEQRKSYIEDLVDISLVQCERYQSVFQLLSHDKAVNTDILSLAMMETLGES